MTFLKPFNKVALQNLSNVDLKKWIFEMSWFFKPNVSVQFDFNCSEITDFLCSPS